MTFSELHEIKLYRKYNKKQTVSLYIKIRVGDLELIPFYLCVFRNTAARAKVVEAWSRDGGVLLMGYEMYRLLSLKKSFVAGRKKKSKKTMGPVVIDLDEEDRQQELLKGE